jgi:hypothetical protein
MRRLRPLPVDLGSGHEVLYALRELYLEAGAPSVRKIAQLTHALSHDTVYRVLTGPALPRWGPLELVVEVLGGDVEAFRRLWISARRAMEDDDQAW